jgi:pilus assembly protein Flp/PilA
MRNLIRFFKNEEGATAIEYGLIASLIAVAVVGVLATVGTNLKTVFTTIQTNL